VTHRSRSNGQTEDGGVAVEFALLLPALLLLVFGIIQFGILFNNYIAITHAAREGVRWAALEEPESVVKDKAVAAAPSLNPAIDPANITVDPPERSIVNQGEPVEVTVSYTAPIIVPFLNRPEILGESITLVASATQRIE